MKLPLQVKVNSGADKVMIYTADGEQLCTVHSGLSIPELRGMKKEEIKELRIQNAERIAATLNDPAHVAINGVVALSRKF